VIQNGDNNPLIYGKSNGATFGGGYGIAIVYQPPVPIANASLSFSTGFNNQWPLAASGSWTFTNSDATQMQLFNGAFGMTGEILNAYVSATSKVAFSTPLDLSKSTQFVMIADAWYSVNISTTTGAGVLIQVTTSGNHYLASGQTVLIQGVAGNTAANGVWVITVTSATQFTLNNSVGSGAYTSGGTVETGVSNFWQQMQLTLGDGSGHSMSLYNPTTDFGTPIFLSRSDIQPQGRVIGVEQIAYPIPTTTPFDLTNVTSITMQWQGNAPPITIEFFPFLMAGSGQFQGTTTFAAAYMATDARQIGPSTQYPTVIQGKTPAASVPIADDARFFYDYVVTIPNPLQADLNNGIDRGLLYAQEPGESQPFLVADIILGTWSGSAWNYTGGIAGSARTFVNYFDQDFGWPALSGAVLCLPAGIPMAITSERLLVGFKSTLWISTAERPFQFYALAQNDSNGNLIPESGTSLTIDGETIQALLSIGSLQAGNEGEGSPANGVSSVFIFTDRTVSQVTGWDAASLSKRARTYEQGTYAPKSVAAFQTGWMMWATDGHIIRYGINPAIPYAGMYPYAVSRNIVEGLLQAVPDARIPFACASVKEELYYLAISPSTATITTPNTFALVWDYSESTRLQDSVWYTDVFPTAVQGASTLLCYRSGTKTHLIGCDLTGQLFEHVTYGQTSDAGISGVAWQLNFPEIKSDGFHGVRVRRMVVNCDANMGTLTTNRATVDRATPLTSSGSINTAVTGPRCVRFDIAPNFPGVHSTGIQVSLGGTSPSGSHVYLASIETTGFDGDGADTGS